MTTAKDVISAIREIAAENPDFTYTEDLYGNCKYYPTPGNPMGCIIGAALTRLGFDRQNELQFERTEGSDVVKYLVGALNKQDERWVSSVQASQDTGTSWANAVIYADAALSNTTL